jgi:hypothetical protein
MPLREDLRELRKGLLRPILFVPGKKYDVLAFAGSPGPLILNPVMRLGNEE